MPEPDLEALAREHVEKAKSREGLSEGAEEEEMAPEIVSGESESHEELEEDRKPTKEHIARATAAGIPVEIALRMPTEKDLDMVIELASQYQQVAQQEPQQKQEEPPPPEPEPEPIRLEISDEDFNEHGVKVIADAVEKAIAAMQNEVKTLTAKQQQMAAQFETASQNYDALAWLDQKIAEAGPEAERIFGKGPTKALAPTSTEAMKRQQLIDSIVFESRWNSTQTADEVVALTMLKHFGVDLGKKATGAKSQNNQVMSRPNRGAEPRPKRSEEEQIGLGEDFVKPPCSDDVMKRLQSHYERILSTPY